MATTEYSPNESRDLTDSIAKIAGFVHSQIILFSSRKKNALVYTLATVVGIFCMPGGIAQFASSADALLVAQKVLPLPFMTIMMAVGLYVFNDLSDVSVDRANGKKRPIPMGLVTKSQTIAFVIGTNSIAAILAIVTANLLTMLMIVPMIALGLLYSAPKIALKDRFVIKTLTIAGLMASCVFLGTTAGSFLTSTDLALPEFAALMVGMMIFVTSPFNDLGDLKGDLAAGRKTIPIVLGTSRTLGMMGVISSSMSAISWVSYFYSAIGISGPLLITAMNSIVLLIILRTREKSDAKSLRNLHSKLVPLHFLLHLGLILGAVFA